MFFCSILCAAQEFQGLVTNGGKPLGQVSIRVPSLNDWQESEMDGSFSLKYHPRFILFVKKGYAPLFRLLPPDTTSISSDLNKESADDNRTLPACGNLKKFAKSNNARNVVGDYFLLPIPKNEKLKRGRDVDYSEYSIWFGDKQDLAVLHGIWGPNASNGLPSKDLIEESNMVKVRLITFDDDLIGEDWEGSSNNGKVWRFIRVRWEITGYETTSKSVKAHFDQIISNACFNTENPLWK
jgi:hypothetical protein